MVSNQLTFDDLTWSPRSANDILAAVRKLREFHTAGMLGGERMPEDANPHLPKMSKENFHYFTLPMALNYQRNSYKLWEAALRTFSDGSTSFVFDPMKAVDVTIDDLREALCKYRLALQPSRHTAIWRTVSSTIASQFNGDIRNLFTACSNDIGRILEYVQVNHKRDFPYLSGQKIANYWLYVMLQYTDAPLQNRAALSVAPDTHVIQASIMLGLVPRSSDYNGLRGRVAQAWQSLLDGTELSPIDIHTPLWLWSKNGFRPMV